jgi:hypothetical protein
MEKIEACILEVAEKLDVNEDRVRETIRDFLLYREFKEQLSSSAFDAFDDTSNNGEDSDEDEDSSSDYEPSEDSGDEYSSEDEDSEDSSASLSLDIEEDKIRQETVEISMKFYNDAIASLQKNKNIPLAEREILEEFYKRQKIDYDEFKGYFSQAGHMLDLYYFTINEQFTSEEIFRMAANSQNFILLVCSIVNNNYKLPSNYKKFIGQGGNSFVSYGGGPLVREEGFREEDYSLQIAFKGIELSRKYKLPITWLHNRVKTELLLGTKLKNSDIIKLIMSS